MKTTLRFRKIMIAGWLICASTGDAAERYVNVNNPAPMAPYTNWLTAATVIQDAVDAAQPGDEVVVTNGIYEIGGRAVHPGMTSRVAVTKPLTLRSVNGPQFTFIRGDDGPTRCVYLTNDARISGFTLTNGNAQWPSSATNLGNGGGIWCESTSATASNCVLVNNRGWEGGGVYRGTIINCTLRGNYAWSGGGASEAILSQCVVIGNLSSQGGGAAGSTLNNCLVASNSAYQSGGGAMGGTLNNCILISNSVNSAWELQSGGGAAYATLNNCLLTGNVTAGYGGGAVDSILNNCTVTGNRAGWGGGVATGCMECYGTNSIIYYNTATAEGLDEHHNYWAGPLFFSGGVCGGMLTINYSCTTPLPVNGSGNITNAPRFVDAGSGNFRLQPDSPCINAGQSSYAQSGPDLDGNPRIVGGTMDIGAYEFQSPQSALSYAWLQQYGLPVDGSADFADLDGDGHNNRQEWRAWTDPTNSVSALRLLTPMVGTNGIQVRWQSVSGQNYFLERSADLGAQAGFAPVASDLIGQSGVTTHTDTNTTGTGPFFYRVRVGE